jgi:hypothetical protein
MKFMLSRVLVTNVMGFTADVQVVTTNKYSTVTNFHTTNHFTLNLLSLL